MKSTIWGGYIQAQKLTPSERIIDTHSILIFGFYSEEKARASCMESALGDYPVSEGWHSHLVALVHLSDENFQALVEEQQKEEAQP